MYTRVLVSLALGRAAAMGQYQTPATPTWMAVEVAGGAKQVCLIPVSSFTERKLAKQACQQDETCAGVAKAEEYDRDANWRTCEEVDGGGPFKDAVEVCNGKPGAQAWEEGDSSGTYSKLDGYNTWTDVEEAGGAKQICNAVLTELGSNLGNGAYSTRNDAKSACRGANSFTDYPKCAGVAKAEVFDADANWNVCEKVDGESTFKDAKQTWNGANGAERLTWE